MPSQQHSLDIIIPCYNPEPGWEDKLIHYYQAIASEAGNNHTSLILVNDGSTFQVSNAQIEKIKKAVPGMKYLEYPINKGKGHALRTGVEASTGELVIFTDVDFPYEVKSLLNIYQELCNGTDVALGYREDAYYKQVPAFRKFLSRALRWALRALLNLSITDTQCGLKGFNQTGKRIFLFTTINRFLFDLEFVMLLAKEKAITSKPVLVSLRDGVVFSKVHMNVLIIEIFNFFRLAFSNRKSPRDA